MAEIKVPTLGESVTEATVARWLKKSGDAVAVDEPLVELETDKVTLEVNASTAGTLGEIVVAEGATVNVGALLGLINDGAVAAKTNGAIPAPAPVATPVAQAAPVAAVSGSADNLAKSGPAARKLVEDNKLDSAAIAASGRDGRLTKGDVLAAIATPCSCRRPAGACCCEAPVRPAPAGSPRRTRPHDAVAQAYRRTA